jgi:hypothetical protein
LFEFQLCQWYYDIDIRQEYVHSMTNWQITAKTIFCEAVDDEVTVLVYKNGSTRCTGARKYNQPSSVTANLVREKTLRLKRPVKCDGEPCSAVMEYKNKILAEETT